MLPLCTGTITVEELQMVSVPEPAHTDLPLRCRLCSQVLSLASQVPQLLLTIIIARDRDRITAWRGLFKVHAPVLTCHGP